MNSILDKDGKYIGHYLHLENNKYCARDFTKYYNLSVQDDNFSITLSSVKDLLNMSKYGISNNIYVNDIKTHQTVIKPLNVGMVMVYITSLKELYLLTEEELDNFLEDNNYISDISINYVLGIPIEHKFKNVRIVVSDSLEHAQKIYKRRYNETEEPICIGIEDDRYLYIPTDEQVLVLKMEQDIFIKK